MKLTSTRKTSKYVNLLLYGKHGVGKTPLIATAPGNIILDVDKGQATNADLDIPVIEIDTLDDLEEAYDYCKKQVKKGKIQTITIEGGWELSDVVFADIKSKMKAQAKEEGKKADTRRAFLFVSEVYKPWVRKFRNLPCNFILTTLMDEHGEPEKYRPYFVGNVLKRELPGMFNQIFCLHHIEEDEEQKVVLQCRECTEYDARDRSRTLKGYEKKDLAYVFKKILKGNK